MKINIITENQARLFARDEYKKCERRMWETIEKLRKRIFELEKKNMDINKTDNSRRTLSKARNGL